MREEEEDERRKVKETENRKGPLSMSLDSRGKSDFRKGRREGKR
jgi:hypothetical protein